MLERKIICPECGESCPPGWPHYCPEEQGQVEVAQRISTPEEEVGDTTNKRDNKVSISECGVGEFRHPSDDRRQRWVLMFEDYDVPSGVFYDEQEALAAFRHAELNWNCHLFTSASRKYLNASGEVTEHEDMTDCVRVTRSAMEQIEATLKLCYRKHVCLDDSISWGELDNAVTDMLCEVIGDDTFVEWNNGLSKS